jgi:penicillin-binding protein 1C
MAAIVADVETGNVLAYVGNIPDLEDTEHGNQVDVIQAPRSTGSILKPFLFAALMESGKLNPTMLVPDIPTRIGSFAPENFDRQFDGAVRANEALARSLNVPAVRMLQDYGVEPFYDFLKKAGISTLKRPPEHYGLSLILGGSEATLWDLTGGYASMARILRMYEEHDGFYESNPFAPLNYIVRQEKPKEEAAQPILHASSVYETFRALLEVKRPGEEESWQMFASPRKIAWKTGTSFGFRDAWAIGVTRDYVVGVWAGNADGEGRSGLTGASAAAPVLFDIFGILPQSRWFSRPADEFRPTVVCSESGYLPSQFCEHTDTVQLPWNLNIKICPYHRLVHLDQTENYQVTALCENPSRMIHKNWFVLPPTMEYYYKNKNPFYRVLPPYKPGCSPDDEPMELIYPHDLNRIFLPVQLDGSPGEVLFEAVHRDRDAVVFWYIDEYFMAETTGKHQLLARPEPGWHTLVLSDGNGNQLTKRFFADSRK